MSKQKRSEPVQVAVTVLNFTERAVLVTEGVKDSQGELEEHWLPRSQIDTNDSIKIGATISVEMPYWLFKEKGFTE